MNGQQRAPRKIQDPLTTRQAAALAGVSQQHIQQEVDAGRLAGFRVGRTHRRVWRRDLDAWMAGRGAGPPKTEPFTFAG